MKKKNIIILLVIIIIASVGIGLCLPKVFKEKEDNKKLDIPEEVAPNEEQKETPIEPEEPEEKHHIDSTDPLIIDGILIVNKSYPLSADYIPENPHEAVNGRDYCEFCLSEETYEHFREMQSAIKQEGLSIWIKSGYRSYNLQNGIYNRNVNRDGKEKADTYSARPGHSEHQTGLAFDLNSLNTNFANTAEGKWLNANAYKYGFILRYPSGKEPITGYMYEPWHFRYVGVDLATELYNNGDWITLEEYFDLTSTY